MAKDDCFTLFIQEPKNELFKNMKRITYNSMSPKHLLAILGCLLLLSGCTQKLQKSEYSILESVIETVQENHIAPKKFDGNLSDEVFMSFLLEIDPEKKIFLAKEIKKLTSQYRSKNRDSQNTSLSFIDDVFLRLH